MQNVIETERIGNEITDYCTIKTNDYTFVIRSIAGIETCCYVKELDVAFDMGLLFGSNFKKGNVFISHGHIDHIGALAKHSFRRSLVNMKPARYFVPPDIVVPVNRMLESFSALQNEEVYDTVIGLEEGNRISISCGYFATSFQTNHRVSSQGYLIWKKLNKLRCEFQGMEGKEIARLKQQGVVITNEVVVPEIAYTGDSTIDVLDRNEILYQVKVLIIELTFLDNSIDEEKAQQRGHIHLNQIIARSSQFQNKSIIFMHFSPRYSKSEVERILHGKLPLNLWEKCFIAYSQE